MIKVLTRGEVPTRAEEFCCCPRTPLRAAMGEFIDEVDEAKGG